MDLESAAEREVAVHSHARQCLYVEYQQRLLFYLARFGPQESMLE